MSFGYQNEVSGNTLDTLVGGSQNKLQFEESDSEDDDTQEELEPVYEIKSIYHSRKLPHVIGTQSFLVRYFYVKKLMCSKL